MVLRAKAICRPFPSHRNIAAKPLKYYGYFFFRSDIAADPSDKGKAPFKLNGAAIVMEFKIITQHHPEPLLFPEIIGLDFSVPEIIFHVGVIVVLGPFGNAARSLGE